MNENAVAATQLDRTLLERRQRRRRCAAAAEGQRRAVHDAQVRELLADELQQVWAQERGERLEATRPPLRAAPSDAERDHQAELLAWLLAVAVERAASRSGSTSTRGLATRWRPRLFSRARGHG